MRPWTFSALARQDRSWSLGVANRKSVAFHIGAVARRAAGAHVVYSVRSPSPASSQLVKLLPAAGILGLRRRAARRDRRAGTPRSCARIRVWHGLVHSIAFADYSAGLQPFHETPKAAFLQVGRHLLLFADRAGQRFPARLRSRRLRRGHLDLDHADGQRKLRLHGPDQGGARFARWCFWPSRSAASRGCGSTPWRRAC